jgi:hypothetical protein
MYERFTNRAREVMQHANKEAQRLQHEYIGTEHILLGLARLDSGVAVSALRNLGVEPRRISQELEKVIQSGPSLAYLGKLPRIPRAKKVIEYAMEEMRNLKHNCIGSEHILLGLLREQEGVAGVVLMGLGLRVEKVRAEIDRLLAQPNDWGRQEFPALPPLQPFEERGRRVVEVPTACPKCGDPRVVRVLWHSVPLSVQNLEDFQAGKAILGSLAEMQGPPWVCLHCSPRWSEVHQLAMQDYQCQLAKEEAVAATNFEAAARHRDSQDDVRRRLWQLIQELLKDQ